MSLPLTIAEYNEISNTKIWKDFWNSWYKGFGQTRGSWSVGPQVTIKVGDDLNAMKLRDLALFYTYRQQIHNYKK